MGYQTLLIEVDEGIGWLTFNRPNKKNAMNRIGIASSLSQACSATAGSGARSSLAWVRSGIESR